MRIFGGVLAIGAALATAVGCAAAADPVADASSTASATTASCRVTFPNGRTPPGEHRNPHHHGNGRLWTQLPLRSEPYLDGPMFTPGTYSTRGYPGLHRDGTATDKFYWWGSRAAKSHLKITGRRLDATAKPLRAHVGVGTAHSPHFWPSYVTFSSSGCWQVTAKAGKKAKLTFRLAVSIPK